MAKLGLTSSTLIEAREGNRPIHVLVGGPQLTLALGRSFGLALKKDDLFERGGHPRQLPCVWVEREGKKELLFDAMRPWFESFFNMGADIQRALAWCHSLVLWSGHREPAERALSTLEAMEHRVPLIAVVGRDQDGVDLCKRVEGREAVTVVEADLNGPRVSKQDLEAIAAVLAHVPSNTDGVAIEDETVMLPDKVTGYGLGGGMLKMFGYPFVGSIRKGDVLEVLTNEGQRLLTTVEERDATGVVFKAPRVRPEQAVSIGTKGLVQLYGREPRYRSEAALPATGHLYVLGTARSLWDTRSGALHAAVAHSAYGNPWTHAIAGTRTPFLFSDARSRMDDDPRTAGCELGWFEGVR